MWLNDPYGRNVFGVPPTSNGDFAWVQHMIKSMAAKTGRMAIVLPQGVLFRGGKENEIRQNLIETDMIECIIGLAGNLFYGATLAACILVLRKSKPLPMRGKIMMVDASTLYKPGRAQNFLLIEHVDAIFDFASGSTSVPEFSEMVPIENIREQGYNLNVSRYVKRGTKEDTITVDEAIKNFMDRIAGVVEAEERFIQLLRQEGLLNG